MPASSHSSGRVGSRSTSSVFGTSTRFALCAALLALFAACGGDDTPAPVDAGAVVDAAPGDAALDASRDAAGFDLAACVDDDGDGYRAASCGGDDCDDADPTRHPGATEVCDGDDEDCDDTTFGADADGDGYVSSACCNGTPNCGDDCDDTLNTVNPRAAEQCNAGIDDDCDGLADAAEGVCRPCPPGFEGFDDACADVNECATPGFCGTGAASCTNVPGTFECTCTAGFAAAAPTGALCENVDECAAAVNPCGAGTCTDNAGSYLCACPLGYRLQTTPTVTCVDVDECAESTDTCDDAPSAACRNTAGSFTCTCPAGYAGDGRGTEGCIDVDECAAGTDDCDDAPDACVNTAATFVCRCPGGYVGDGRGMGGCLFDEPSLSGLGVGVGATLSPVFASGTLAYALLLPPGVPSTTLVPSVAEPTRATITVDGATVASGASAVVTTGVAPTVVSIVVATESGATRSYFVTVVRRSAYVKASNTGMSDWFGYSVALAEDGGTLAVGAYQEDSATTGIGGDQTSNAASESGAVYVFRRSAGGVWAQEAYVKASNTGASDHFGWSVALSGDGGTLAVGAYQEDSAATGVGGNQTSNAVADSGSVYVFRRSAGGVWAQEAYVKASNTGTSDRFGSSVALSGDGATLAVGAYGEDSATTGIGGDQTSNAAATSGAVYVFRQSAGGMWAQEAYVKASNTGASDEFGWSVALSGDGATLAVGAWYEDSAATGVGGDESSNAANESGAVYVFRRSAGGVWAQEAYVKASNTDVNDSFGYSVALSGDGATLAVGAYQEGSAATGVGGDQTSEAANSSGAVYVFRRSVGGVWAQEAYVKASNTGAGDFFGYSVALSGDGATLAVGAYWEDSAATGIGGDQTNSGGRDSGAVYVFRRSTVGVWTQEAYVKASNTGTSDRFGYSVALSGDGATLAVGAYWEDSAATGIGGDQTSNAATDSGAVYVF
jgi:hypothetical protein